MNLARVLSRYPGLDCRRVDLSIGEKEYWNQGIGTAVIRALTNFGFTSESADVLCGMVYSHNPRSRRAFKKAGYRETSRWPQADGAKAEYEWELSLRREDHRATDPLPEEVAV